MQIAVVSDTHGHAEYARQAVHRLEKLEIGAVLHCGDIGSPAIVRLFDRWPTHFVFGNVDYDERSLRDEIETAGQTCHERFGSIELEGRRIALLHGNDFARFQQTVSSGEWDLICYGHTHFAKQEVVGKTLVLNPGALYRAKPHSFALVDLATLDAAFVTL
jgi:putative phosphoesterase